MQLTHADTVEGFKAAIEGRLQALSNAHTLLAQSRWSGANLHSLVTEELAPYSLKGIARAQINGPEALLEPKSAQAIAMILHELTTNSVKYGALSVPSGRLRVEWSRDETQLMIRWSEEGGPPVNPPSRQGFGTRVVDRIVKAELKGRLRFDWKPEGLACEILSRSANSAERMLKRPQLAAFFISNRIAGRNVAHWPFSAVPDRRFRCPKWPVSPLGVAGRHVRNRGKATNAANCGASAAICAKEDNRNHQWGN